MISVLPRKLLSKDWEERLEDDKLVLERILILIRNILQGNKKSPKLCVWGGGGEVDSTPYYDPHIQLGCLTKRSNDDNSLDFPDEQALKFGTGQSVTF